ncbi:MAG: helix-turn-helix transcriptional regulator [Clostridium sp.]|nr:helix-turn-helix transcriptional regulator [Clostridium sp.]
MSSDLLKDGNHPKESKDTKEKLSWCRNEAIRKELKKFRESKKLSVRQMAKELAPPDSTDYRPNYSAMENGKKPVNKALVKRIGEVFDNWKLWLMFTVPEIQERMHHVIDQEDVAITKNLLEMLQKSFYSEIKDTVPGLDDNLRIFMEKLGYKFTYYERSNMYIMYRILNDESRVRLDFDNIQSLNKMIRYIINGFFLDHQTDWDAIVEEENENEEHSDNSRDTDILMDMIIASQDEDAPLIEKNGDNDIAF